MIEVLVKILGHILGALFLLGIIGFFMWMIQYAWYAAKGRISFIFPFWFVVSGKLMKPKEEQKQIKPKKQRKPKPEWWRFLTEESIGSLLEKRRRRKAEADARANDPWTSR